MKHPVDVLVDSAVQAPVIRAANQLKAENERLRAEIERLRTQAEEDTAAWFSLACRAARRARQAERQRCAAIAQDLDCEEWPPEYRIAAPEIDPYMPEWEKAQCYHGDRIAAVILGQEDAR